MTVRDRSVHRHMRLSYSYVSSKRPDDLPMMQVPLTRPKTRTKRKFPTKQPVFYQGTFRVHGVRLHGLDYRIHVESHDQYLLTNRRGKYVDWSAVKPAAPRCINLNVVVSTIHIVHERQAWVTHINAITRKAP